MAKIDQEYHQLINVILSEGFTYEDPNRKGVNRIQIPSYKLKHNFKDGFPAITTKKLYWKGIVGELLWFLRGDTNIKYLVDNGINIWTSDYNVWKNKFYNIQQEDLGKIYGHQLRNFGGDYKYNFQPVPKINYQKEIIPPVVNRKYKHLGKIYKSNSREKFKVIDHIYKEGYTIQFLNNGFVVNGVSSSTLLKGNIKNLYSASVFGVGCRGEVQEKRTPLLIKIEKVWYNILKRCYDKNSKDYPQYGKKGVYVENSWLIFSNFLKDVKELKGWNNKFENWKDYDLDKDLLGSGLVYGRKHCSWLSKSENLDLRNCNYTLKNIETGEIVKISNLNMFLEERGIGKDYHSHFSLIKQGKRKTCKGWEMVDYTESKSMKKGFDQLEWLINTLKNNPMATKKTVSFINPNDKEYQALSPCHTGFKILTEPLSYKDRYDIWINNNYETGVEYNCNENKPINFENEYYSPTPKYQFTLQWEQDSVDTFLGLPFNIASYALLAQIIGKMINMVPKGIEGDLSNVHLYEPHLKAVEEQLGRDVNRYDKCELDVWKQDKEAILKSKKFTLDQKLDLINIHNFKLKDYKSYPTIKAKMLPYSN